VNLGPNINTRYHDYLPTVTADEKMLLFTTRLRGKNEDFFYSTKVDTVWQKAIRMGEPISTPNYNEGSLSITPDGKRIYFSVDYTGPGKSNFDLYYSDWDGESWTVPVSLGPDINTGYYEAQPSISADQKVLFFTSNRPGGMGRRDLWVSRLKPDSTWSKPANLGSHINTKGDEEVPLIHPDNKTLYFGSNGHPGMGGSDLYYCRLEENGRWSEPINLGYPINTPENEGSLFVSADGMTGYFASDRLQGYGGFDLYKFEMPEKIRPFPVTYCKALVFDKKTGQPLSSTIELFDLGNGSIITTTETRESNNEFLVTLPIGSDYALNVSRPGYLFHSEHFSLVDTQAFENYIIRIELSPIEVDQFITLRNVFFDVGQHELKISSEPELNKLYDLLVNTRDLSVEIGGHTDNTGMAGSNIILSEKRAQAVYDYLVNKGISSERLAYKGYGDMQPTASNDSEEGRALNRRTEAKVVEYQPGK